MRVYFAKIATLVLMFATTHALAANKTNDVEHITIVNNSNVILVPTAEGWSQGCMGGSLPPFLNPIAPHTSRDVNIIFVKYSSSCKFDVLPEPSIITYLQACHSVKANDTLTFTGENFINLRCQVNE